MIIQPAVAADTRRVWELICILEDTELPLDAFEAIYLKQLRSDGYRCLMARESADAPAAGVINIRIEPQLHHAARVADIMELVVDPACRSAGVGHELFQAGCAAAREAGCVQIELETSCWRASAHRSYTMKL